LSAAISAGLFMMKCREEGRGREVSKSLLVPRKNGMCPHFYFLFAALYLLHPDFEKSIDDNK
jgi:hypothetical protein